MTVITLYTTWPSADAAEACARALVEAQVAACCTLLPGAVSLYRWEGAVQRDAEVVLLIKTTPAQAKSARALILAAHPYDVPCVLAWPADPQASHGPYMDWAAASVVSDGSP